MKNLFLLGLLLISLVCYSQDKAGIYYKNAKGDYMQLGYSRITGTNVGNIAGAYLTLGLSAANSNYVIEGKSAEVLTKENPPQFIFKFGDDPLTKYIFTSSDNIDYIRLVKLHPKKNSRNLRTGKYGLTAGVQKGLNDEDIIPIKTELVDENTILVIPKEKIKKGEYCFYFTGESPEDVKEFIGVFDFSIKK